MTERYFEDFSPGQHHHAGPVTLDTDSIITFATQFDPQPFHTDEIAARDTFFGGLAASGWHTAALTMRMMTESGMNPVGGLIGAGGEQLRWPRPVRPGDTLRLHVEIIEVRVSASKPGFGFVTARFRTLNQRDEEVQLMTARIMVPRRPG